MLTLSSSFFFTSSRSWVRISSLYSLNYSEYISYTFIPCTPNLSYIILVVGLVKYP